MGVSRVGALRCTTEVVSYRSGGGNTFDSRLPGRTMFEAVTLERGITHDHAVERWARLVHGLEGVSVTDLRNDKRDMSIELMNPQEQVAIRCFLFTCWPSCYTALPDLDAGANAVAVESLTLEAEQRARDHDATEPAEGL